MKKQLLFLFGTVLLCFGARAQVSAYVFSQGNSAYTPISPVGATTIHAAGWDDDNPANGPLKVVNIPFNFTFDGSIYTSCEVSTNGFIIFSSQPSSAHYEYNPISSTENYNGAISAFGHDLFDNFSGSGNPILATTIGTAPNRTFVIQWTNAQRSGSSFTADSYNFQIRLSEGGGTATSQSITIQYGVCTATSLSSRGIEVGLRGATNADFNNRTTGTDWALTTSGVLNSNTCVTSSAVNPVSGLSFIYSPSIPTCPRPAALGASNITSSSANFTWTPGGSETSWDVYYALSPLTAPDATTVPTATTSVASYSATGLTQGANYSLYIRAKCSTTDMSSWTPVFGFNTSCIPPTLISSTGSSLCGTGTATLSATGSTGSDIRWYAGPSGGLALSTGTLFTTPSIASTTNYYVTATSSSALNVGKVSTTGADGQGNSYMTFDAFSNVTLNSVVIYPYGTGTGTITIKLENSSGTLLQSTTFTVQGSLSAAAQTIPLNLNINPGTAYRLTYSVAIGPSFISLFGDYGTGVPFPYTVPGLISITGSGFYANFFNWDVSTGCESARTMVTATVNSLPAVTASSSSTLICSGSSALLTATGSTGNTYSWNTGATTTTLSVSPAVTTIYTVTATNVCGTATAAFTQSVSPCTGIEEMLGPQQISIYPNPASAYVNIGITSYLSSNHTVVEITDALGKVVMNEGLSTELTTISLNKLPEGIYFFKVITNNQVVKVGKVVKQ